MSLSGKAGNALKAARHRHAGLSIEADERQLRELMDGLGASVFVGLLYPDGTLIYANRAALDAIGATPEEVVGVPFDATRWWAFSEEARRNLRNAIEAAAGGVASRFEIMFEDRDNRRRFMDFTLHPVFAQDGKIAYLVPSAHDVTERKNAEKALRLTQFAVDHASGALLQIDNIGRLRYANDSACKLFGYSRDALMGMRIFDIDIEATEESWPERWREFRERKSLQFETVARRSDGRKLFVEISASHIEYEAEEYSFAYVADISERKAAEERIHHLAHHDGLTGLPNRGLLRDRLSQTLVYAERDRQPVWVASIDIDGFKFVNDTLGHESGDMLLKAVAERMQSAVRETDTVARLSADEFVLVLAENPGKELSITLLQSIMKAIAEPIRVIDKNFFLTCGVGVAVYPTDGADAETLLKHAGVAMYRAKEMGRNQFQFYTASMNKRALERLRIEAALRDAVERQEFVLHYQPQVDLHSGCIVGMEALIRWNHPELGMMAPANFIGLAEETDLIVPMGLWALRTACAQTKAWQQAGHGELRIAVNLSARQFARHDLLSSIAAALEETGLAPHCLEIELTESLFMADIDHAIGILRGLKALGIKLAIDDFGTGYSSLSYLKRFPVDVLKIDQSFVRDITKHANDASIVTSIISLARSLRLHVIAEGVEHPEQLAYLRQHDCDEIQGYFFSPPVDAAAFEDILRERRCLPGTS